MIQFNKVSKSFRRRVVLDGLDLTLERGERAALVGANGAGKTTLIRCLLGEYQFHGEIRIDGLSPREHRSDVLARMGFVPQLPPPLKMPVTQLITFSAKICNTDPGRISALTERLGLDLKTIARQPFVKLSGGQKQKLLIGIALGRDSDILIMDEPAANLDPDARRTFFKILAERRENAVMLISSHRLDEVAPLVNRVIELDYGKVVLDDCVEEFSDMASALACKIRLARPDEAFAKTIAQWRFRCLDGGAVWEGEIAGADRLRFLSVLSRYAGVLAGVSLQESEIRLGRLKAEGKRM